MFHIGATSYVIPADLAPNAEYLATRVDDMELVLFESPEWGSNFPTSRHHRPAWLPSGPATA